MKNRNVNLALFDRIAPAAVIGSLALGLMVRTAAADDFPAGPQHDLVAKACSQCHQASVVTSQHKSAPQWAETVRLMMNKGVSISEADFNGVVTYLAQNFGAANSAMRADAAASPEEADKEFARYQAVPGQPIQVRAPNKVGEVPAFAGQTRAPYQASNPYKLAVISDKLRTPWGLAFLPDGKFLISERIPGALLIVDSQGKKSAPLKGVEAVSRVPDFGLLDVVLDPDFSNNHRIFFTFFEIIPVAPGEKPTGSNTYVARATLNEAGGTINDVKVIFRSVPAIPSKRLGGKTGGRIAIDPNGNLFVAIGDRDDNGVNPWTVSQQMDSDLGKMIHITPDGEPAPDNPFLGKPGVLPEIWSSGIRSPEGLAYDPHTGKLWETEHGPNGGDELNIIERGRNYGWPIIAYGIDYGGEPINNEGTQKEGMEQPVYFWDPVIAPSGFAFYKGDLFPQWKNSAFSGGLRGKVVTRLVIVNDRVVGEEALLTELHSRIRDVRVGPDGALYVLTEDTGDNSRLVKLTPR
jgi:aldose sugar dehydrogenase